MLPEVRDKPEVPVKGCVLFQMHIFCPDFRAIVLCEGLKVAAFGSFRTLTRVKILTLFMEVCAAPLAEQQCLQLSLLTQLPVVQLMQRDGFTARVAQIM